METTTGSASGDQAPLSLGENQVRALREAVARVELTVYQPGHPGPSPWIAMPEPESQVDLHERAQQARLRALQELASRFEAAGLAAGEAAARAVEFLAAYEARYENWLLHGEVSFPVIGLLPSAPSRAELAAMQRLATLRAVANRALLWAHYGLAARASSSWRS